MVKGGLQMPTAFVAQDGVEIHESTLIGVMGCLPPTRPRAGRARKARVGKAGRGRSARGRGVRRVREAGG
jgi:hypothetical protein